MIATVTSIAAAAADRPSSNPTCAHDPRCPGVDAVDATAARTVVCMAEQGWSLLCNGLVVFDDTGTLKPDGTATQPCRGPSRPGPA